MSRAAGSVVVIVAMIAAIVALDILVFRHHFWLRLAANVGVVLLAGAFYFRYLHK